MRSIPDMIRICVMCVLLCLASTPLLHAASPDEEYLPIYNRIQEADRLLRSGREAEARQRFLQAQTELEELGRLHPDWNPNVVQFRLNYITTRLADLPRDPADTSAPPPKVAPSVAPQPVPSADEIDGLRNQVENLERENERLTARLREALAARAADTDPEELARAEERIREQQREIELLRVNLDRAQQATTPTTDPALAAAQRALEEARLELSAQTEKMAAISLERDALQTRLLATVTELENLRRQPTAPAIAPGTPEVSARMEVTSAEAEQLKRKMQELHQELAEERARNDNLAAERALLESRLDELAAQSTDPSVIRIRTLEKELATARDITRADSATISALQTALAVARQEQTRLEDELRQQRHQAVASRPRLSEPVATAPQPPRQDLDKELAELQSRLAILEARRVPYTPEELALFRVPAISRTQGPEGSTPGQTRPAPSAGAVTLIAEAEQAARAGRYAEAEESYQEALQLDQENVDVLARLAALQIEQDRWEPARATLDRALALNPRDASSLYHLGRVYYQEGRLDDALTVLSRAAHLDGSKPQIFDFLGITLGRMGLRDPAETALRRAVQLAPGNGSAHHNLAVIYSLQEPPATELARWHYQRALAAGYPRNQALETQLDGTNQ
jgi:tetratricopeptide (TPR) repeat protein